MEFLMEINRDVAKIMEEQNLEKNDAFQVLCSNYIKSNKFKLVTKDTFQEYKDLDVLKYFNNAIYAYRQYYIFNYVGEFIMIDYTMFLITKHVIDLHSKGPINPRRLEINWHRKNVVIRIRSMRFSLMTLYRAWHEHERSSVADSDLLTATHHVNELKACCIVDNLVPLTNSEHGSAHSFAFFKLASNFLSTEDYAAYRLSLMKEAIS